MAADVIIIAIIFGAIFSIAYLYFSTRNKERLALIEKGTDASAFVKGQSRNVWKLLLLNTSLLAMGIGLGIFIGSILFYGFGIPEEVAFPGSIFFTAGAGLFMSHGISRKMDEDR